MSLPVFSSRNMLFKIVALGIRGVPFWVVNALDLLAEKKLDIKGNPSSGTTPGCKISESRGNMSKEQLNLEPGEEILFQARPAWKTFWVFIFGALLCGVGPFLQENPPLSIEAGLVFCTVFVLIIWRRWSNVYTLTNQRIRVFGGLFYKEGYDIKLENISDIQAHQGLTLKLVGAGHLLIRSSVPNQENIIMYGQPDPYTLQDRMLGLAAKVKSGNEIGA